MGSPITFSGFNSIDFNVVLNAIMQQESRPLQALQTQQAALKATDSAFAQLAGKLDALRTASSALSKTSSLSAHTAASSDTSAVSVSASSSAVPGRYDVVVNELARAQVTVSATSVADTDTTVVADGGTLTIGGVAVALSGPVTLRQLATQINGASDLPATASIVETAPGEFRLALTGRNTGAAGAFLVENQLTSSAVAFTDTDDDGVSGDSGGDNAVAATNASVLINNIPVTSSSNTLEAGIPGVTVTLLQKDPAKTVAVTVSRDDQAVADRLETFVSAYNDLVAFATEQSAAAGNGRSGTLGRDGLLRSVRGALRDALSSAHGTGTYTRLAEIGVGFTRTGQLTLDQTALSTALASHSTAIQTLFANPGTGVFTSITSVLNDYTQSGGFVPDARSRLSDEVSRLERRMDDMQARLAIRRAALQREFTAADQAMSRLNGQKSSLASFGASLNGAF